MILDIPWKIEELKVDYSKAIFWMYDYSESYKNLVLFWKNTVVNDSLINEKISEIDDRILKIIELKKEVENDNSISIALKNFYERVLTDLILKFELIKNSIYLEAEKTSYVLSEEDRKKYLYKVELLQNEIYWLQVSDIPEEKKISLNILFTLYSNKKDLLTIKEQKEFYDFLLSFWEELSVINKTKQKNDLDNIPIWSEDLVLELFNLVLDANWILKSENNPNWWEVELSDDIKNFRASISDRKMIIPLFNASNYSIMKILRLFDHEISTHGVRWYNMWHTLKMSSPNYVNIEEALAKINEFLFDNNIEDLDVLVSDHTPRLLIAENLNWEDTKRMLTLYYKMSGKKDKSEIQAINMTRRLKKFVSYYEKWANRRDTSYTRGVYLMRDFLENKDNRENFKDLYFSKIELKDLSLVDELKEFINKEDLRYPLFVWKILYKKLLWNKIFLNDIQIKGENIEWLKKEDFRFEWIDKLDIKTKRIIVETLRRIKKLI